MRLLAAWAAPVLLCCQAAAEGFTCDPPAAIQPLSPDSHASINLSQAERKDKIAAVRQALAQSPDNLFLNRWLIELQSKPHTGALSDEFHAKLDQHPGDRRWQYLYAAALVGKDTPSAIKSLQQLGAQDPNFPWTYLTLTGIFSSAAFRDQAQVAANLRAFHHACSASLGAFEYLNVITDESALRELAGDLRAILRATDAPQNLRYWPALWAAEFRLTPPAELDRARRQVADDLKAIEPLAQGGQPFILNVLSEGYRLSAQPEAEKRLADRLAAARPRNPYFEAYQAWEKEHPRGSTRAEWEARSEALYKATAEWIKQWPDDHSVWEQRRAALVETRSHSAEDWKQVANGLMRTGNGDERLKSRIAYDWVAAGVLLPEAVSYLREVLDWSETPPPAPSDLIQGTIAADLDARERAASRFGTLLTLSQAATKLKDFDLARASLAKVRLWLDSDFRKYYGQDPMTFPDHEGKYLTLMGDLAEAEGRKLDALAYYQQLIVNPWYMREYGGRVEKTRSLFKELGGSDETWAVWSKIQPLPADKPEMPRYMFAMAWNALARPLPEMRIPDAAGRTWTLADFKGKTTFVWLWATWCSPCWRELPAMQKLYDAVKDRRDVQAISLSMDENPAIVEKFMKERKFSFPVLVSKAYVEQVLPEVILGQTWLIDQTAGIRLQRQGAPYPDQWWVDEALDKLNHPPR